MPVQMKHTVDITKISLYNFSITLLQNKNLNICHKYDMLNIEIFKVFSI